MSRFAIPLRLCAALLLGGTLSACGDDLEPSQEEDDSLKPTDGANMSHKDNGDESFTTTVDAQSSEAWIGLDLDTGAQVSADEDTKWDLAFRRFNIRTRGGISGTGGVEVALVPDVTYDQVSTAPTSGYAADGEDGPDQGEDPDSAFQSGDGWYSYNVQTHKLTARTQVYVVQSDSGDYFKLQMLSYYDSAGTPAVLQFRWGRVKAP